MEPEEYPWIAQVEETHWWYRGLRERVIAECDGRVGVGTMILDIGCGTGGTMAALRRRFPAARIVGIDLSPRAIFFAVRKLGRDLVRASANELPFRSGSFDLIFTLDVLYHAAIDEEKVLDELLMLLKPGGTVVINVPAFEWMRSYHDAFVHTARRYTARKFHAKAASVGFEVVRCEYRNSLLFPLMVIERLVRKIFRPPYPRSAVVRHWTPINLLFSAVMALENRLLKRGVRFPAGGSVFAVLRKSSQYLT